MRTRNRRTVLLAACAVILPAILVVRAYSSDHADTPTIAASPGGDLTDVYIFPAPADNTKVVLVMNAHPLITPGNGLNTVFDPNVLYQFKIDNNNDFVEDLVIQAKFEGTNPAGQLVKIYGPAAPPRIGTTTQYLPNPDVVTGRLNNPFTLSNGIKVFAGAREDSFFFDLDRFFTIFPDRATPLNGITVPQSQANNPQAGSWRNPGVDYLAGFNVMSIVVELPRTMLEPPGGSLGKIHVWCTTSR